MPAAIANPVDVPCHDEQGRLVATIRIWSKRKDQGTDVSQSDLISLPVAEARARGEHLVQLRERGRYIYRIYPEKLGLLLKEARGVTRNPGAIGSGEIEPGDHCGILPLVLVSSGDEKVVGTASVEVRSVKMHYREHYRGMLNSVAERCAGLLLDSRAATQLRFSSEWRKNRGSLEQQLEFLRHILESGEFQCAIDEVLRNPHRLLENEQRVQPVGRPFKAGRDFARQVGKAGDRVALPSGHALRNRSPAITSLPARIQVSVRRDFLDTAENRFVKMVLVEFRDFLVEVGMFIGRDSEAGANAENTRLVSDTRRLQARLEALLGRGFFPEVERPDWLPLGSPVLQRKAGYREVLHLWLQFHAGAQLAWDSGGEIWQGGSRNVAALYEYWLFFELESLFRSKFSCDEKLHSILLEKENGLPRLRLKRGVELKTPVGGVWSRAATRPLKAEFHFNKKFNRSGDHGVAGSWTRGVQPDYTISIWPAEFSKAEAERCEVMVHVHFDAKYRVESVQTMFGKEEDDELIQDRAQTETSRSTAAKYSDLLKMHAYRDAIRRTAGAYVLYPGNPGDGKRFEEFDLSKFHEILPGLGAFAIRPRADGTADGMQELSRFLDDVIEHLANRATERERVSFYQAESYRVQEAPVSYGALQLDERDGLSESKRALPPADHFVVVAPYESQEQLDWTRKTGQVTVRLGDRPGTWRVPPEFASARHVLLRSHDRTIAAGLWKLADNEPGYKIFTADDLNRAGYPGGASGEIYAVFKVEEDPRYREQKWDGAKMMAILAEFEARRGREWKGLGHRSPDPRVLSLRELLKAVVPSSVISLAKH
jgi:predicted component of viral defense system (DUF524 family)